MAEAPNAALVYYDEQSRVTEAAVRAAALLWAQLDASNVSASWERDGIADAIFLAVAQSQELAAASADGYADLILAAQNIQAQAEATVVPSSLAGVASDGRDLASLLLQPVITTAVARAGGMTPAQAMNAGLSALTRIVGTQVVDAGRAASSISVTTRGDRIGYIRMLSPGACGRCTVLAGRWYRYDAGFDRHPLCKCVGIPSAEDTLDEALTDPDKYFKSLPTAASLDRKYPDLTVQARRDIGLISQEDAFTVAGAKAIRDGSDIGQVVNARRGALGLSTPGRISAAERKLAGTRGRLERTDVYGRSIFITTEGTTKRGVAGKLLIARTGQTVKVASGTAIRISSRGPVTRDVYRTVVKAPRLMPEAIYELATDRADAVRLLRLYGYAR